MDFVDPRKGLREGSKGHTWISTDSECRPVSLVGLQAATMKINLPCK